MRGKLTELPNRALENDLCEFSMDDFAPVVGEASIDDVLWWHTHPSGNIGPSKTDLDWRLKGFQYMVVALTESGAIPVRY